eukprot:PhM_4_TR5987/c0_g1_i1/m.99465
MYGHSYDASGDEASSRMEVAVHRIQQRWRRSHAAAVPTISSAHHIAAHRLQHHWRQRRQARDHGPHAAASPTTAVAAMPETTEEEEDDDYGFSSSYPTDETANGARLESAIHSLQRLWRLRRHMRPDVQEPHSYSGHRAEELPSEHSASVERAINRIQRLWRERQARLLEQGSAHAALEGTQAFGPRIERAIHHIQRLWRDRQATRDSSVSSVAAAGHVPAAHASLQRPQSFHRAVSRLQRLFREHRRDRAMLGAGNHSSDADGGGLEQAAARRIQARWRSAMFRRRLYDVRRHHVSEEAARLIQRSWQSARERLQFARRVEAGRGDAAARAIQLTWRRARHHGLRPPPLRCAMSDSELQSRDTAAADFNDAPVLCRLCYSRPIEVALLPCGHAFTCVGCSSQLNRCCMCRSLVGVRQRIYLP